MKHSSFYLKSQRTLRTRNIALAPMVSPPDMPWKKQPVSLNICPEHCSQLLKHSTMANKAIHNMQKLPMAWQSMNVCMSFLNSQRLWSQTLKKWFSLGIYHLIISYLKHKNYLPHRDHNTVLGVKDKESHCRNWMMLQSHLESLPFKRERKRKNRREKGKILNKKFPFFHNWTLHFSCSTLVLKEQNQT